MKNRQYKYLMENPSEARRLDIKTIPEDVIDQATWAGVQPGMSVADVGCGSGKTTETLHRLVAPGGWVVGIDRSEERLEHARKDNTQSGITYTNRDITRPLDDLGTFDFVWIRFVLEYYRRESRDIVKNISGLVKPGGILCLIDLDYNSLTHFGIDPVLETTICNLTKELEESHNFDPYCGRKLYSFLYEEGYQEIEVKVSAHHIIYGHLRDADLFNWSKKLEVVGAQLRYPFSEYEGGMDEFKKRFIEYFKDPKRFIYTPLICCSGRKPL
ncbi:MAG: class I SAM-dependent methyltransferase [Thermodesulfovibrionales bacterium]